MSETATQPLPPLVVNVQYTKDLSFEVPNAPVIYTVLRTAPVVNINLDVQVRRVQEGQTVFEVTLAARAEATIPTTENGGAEKPMVVFIADLSYAGIFTLTASRMSSRSRSCWWNAHACSSPSPATSWPTLLATAASRR